MRCLAHCALTHSQDVTTCECMCPHVACPGGFVADEEHCGCKCASECSDAHVVNPATCACECGKACPAGRVHDKSTCACHCAAVACPAGQVQDPNTCGCVCTTACPAGQIQVRVRSRSVCRDNSLCRVERCYLRVRVPRGVPRRPSAQRW